MHGLRPHRIHDLLHRRQCGTVREVRQQTHGFRDEAVIGALPAGAVQVPHTAVVGARVAAAAATAIATLC